MTAHVLVMYPRPSDTKAFDRAYREEHLPYAGPRLTGATGVVSHRVVAARDPASPFYAISDITFPTIAALEAWKASPAAREAITHATSISTGGPPQVLVLTDDLAG